MQSAYELPAAGQDPTVTTTGTRHLSNLTGVNLYTVQLYRYRYSNAVPGASKEKLGSHVRPAPPVDFCEVDPMQTESLTCKIACICLYLRAHARALRHI